jgi:hypothetical protein
MKPVNFKASNANFVKPESMTEEQCGELPVMVVPDPDLKVNICISCWELSLEEILEIVKTGRLWLSVYGGQPPVLLQVSTPEPVVKVLDYIKAKEN